MDKLQFIKDITAGKKILILGFGREGQSSLHYLRSVLPGITITIADSNEQLFDEQPELLSIPSVVWNCGSNYLDSIPDAGIIIKSPGISMKLIAPEFHHKITSQTDWFIRAFQDQICGITGTKGKSTTSSLLYHIFFQSGLNTILVGNIGIPPLSAIGQITEKTLIVNELSCHQLQNIKYSPSAGILLNIFQEHLDHYKTLEEYQLTKLNIALHQKSGEIFIYHHDDEVTSQFLRKMEIKGQRYSYSLFDKAGASTFVESDNIFFKQSGNNILLVNDLQGLNLKGEHNLLNIMAASTLAFLKGVQPALINSAVHSFLPLEHRLEYAGKYHQIHFYNDSISTTPESTIQALKTLKNVYTLILGGTDRGISYNDLIDHLFTDKVKIILLTGNAGKRIKNEILLRGNPDFTMIEVPDYKTLIGTIINNTPAGKICLLSPAAASYDWFKNFEERGTIYKKLIQEYPFISE
ncbi:MAG: UDP-N-acetylmuramoyl-L-alanine--D-glutamate ligase [Bacteroidales bacterium]